MVQPLVDFTEAEFAEGDGLEDRRFRASATLWVGKFARKPLPQQIKEPVFFFGVFSFDQTRLSSKLLHKERPSLPRAMCRAHLPALEHSWAIA